MKIYLYMPIIIAMAAVMWLYDEAQMLSATEAAVLLVELLVLGVPFLICAIRSRPRPSQNKASQASAGT